MKEQSIEELLQSETEKRLARMERNDYEFPKTITRIDITVIMILIGISLLLIFFCMIGVIKG